MKTFEFNKSEIQSNFNRIDFAENLILQLPKDHDGRNTWLLNFGKGAEATILRNNRKLDFDDLTQSAI